MQLDYETYKLPNGMEIILIPSDTIYSVTITSLIKSGSALENRNNQGITHFIEHLSLTANEKWKTKNELNKIAEWNGASFNASTGKDLLKYYITIPYNKIDYGLEFIYQSLYKTHFVQEYIKTERTVILDEISKNNDNVYYGMGRFFIKNLSSNDNYKLPIIGSENTVQNFSIEDLQKHQKLAHDPSKVTLVIVGNFKTIEVKRLIQKGYSKIVSNNPLLKEPVFEIQTGQTIGKFDKKTDLILTTLTLKGRRDIGKDIVQDVISGITSSILCGPTTSRLYSRLREKEGLLYGVDRYSLVYNNYGVTEISFEQIPDLYEKTVNITLEELKRFYNEGITTDELEHYKEYIINRNLVRFDNVYSLSKLIVDPIRNEQKVYTIEELNQFIRDLSVNQVNAFIKKYANPNDINIVSYGNISNSTIDITKNIRIKQCQ